MNAFKKFFKSFTLFEIILWSVSAAAIVLSFILCKNSDYLKLAGSLLGICSLLLVAKGNVAGQFLMLGFCIFYGVVSCFYRYYGEAITYLGMSAPASIVAIVTWLRHPFRGNKSQVEIRKLKAKEYPVIALAALAGSIVFYFILRALNTANLWISTLSVLTSLLAMLLSIRRSPVYALAYAANDIVLVVLWVLAALNDTEAYSLVACFGVFLANDVYGFFNWLKMQRTQRRVTETAPREQQEELPKETLE